MQVPIELFVWMLGGVGAFLSIVIHLLIKLNSNITEVKQAQAIFQVRAEARIRMLFSRHRPNVEETEDYNHWEKI